MNLNDKADLHAKRAAQYLKYSKLFIGIGLGILIYQIAKYFIFN